MIQEQLRKEAIAILAEHGTQTTVDQMQEHINDDNAVLKLKWCLEAIESALTKGAEFEAERITKTLNNLVKKYEDKIKSVENLINPPMGRGWGDAPSHSDIERLKARIYERKTFLDDLKSILPSPTKTNK